MPQPLDDRTQNANASGEYAGTTPWGTRWNTSLKYSGSFYSNENKSIDVDNPFCRTCSAVGRSLLSEPSLFRYGLYPDNNVNGATWSTAVEFPLFKTRYISNVQYMAFRQNDPFLNDATNGLTFGLGAGQIRPYPAASLNGEVNAFLTNNVLYSRLTNDLTNTARVRYYDRRDNTPTLAFTNYAYADSGVATAQPLTREPTLLQQAEYRRRPEVAAQSRLDVWRGIFLRALHLPERRGGFHQRARRQGLRQLDTI